MVCLTWDTSAGKCQAERTAISCRTLLPTAPPQHSERRVEEGGKPLLFALGSSQCTAQPSWHCHSWGAASSHRFLELGAELPCQDGCLSGRCFAGHHAGLLVLTRTALVEIHQVPGRTADLPLWHTPSEGNPLAASAGLVCWPCHPTLLLVQKGLLSVSGTRAGACRACGGCLFHLNQCQSCCRTCHGENSVSKSLLCHMDGGQSCIVTGEPAWQLPLPPPETC